MGHLRTASIPEHPPQLPHFDNAVAVREQLTRILASRLFTHSKRYPALLQYIVEQTLAGNGSDLKERTIGIEVFQRDPEYDTNADPVVRVTAAEIRKRLAQYYFDAGHEDELRIELTPGSYVPVFHSPVEHPRTSQNLSTETLLPVQLFARSEAPTPEPPTKMKGARLSVTYLFGSKWIWLTATLVLLPLGWFFFLAAPTPQFPGFEEFWGQVINASGPVQICFGAYVERNPTGPGLPLAMDAFSSTALIAGVLEQRGKTYSTTIRMIGPSAADFSEFRYGPVIYFGPLSPVTQLTNSWRYRFLDDTTPRWIADSESSFKKLWKVEEGIPPADLSEGYSIATRLVDPTLKRPVIVVVGFSRAGVSSGVELLTTPEYLEPILRSAPKNWQEMNFQVVVQTRIQDGKHGAPTVVATHFWKE